MRTLLQIFANLIDVIKDLLVPEDEKISRLLRMQPDILAKILPRSPTLLKDIDILFDYRHKAVKLLIRGLKYKNNIALKKFFALSLSDRLLEISSEILLFTGKQPIIVPIPMSKNELRERGFNQCEELLRQFKKISPKNFDIRFDILEKIRDTPRQARLDREKRIKNIYMSMQVRDSAKPQIENRVVIVVDDVYTTGATFTEAKRSLLEGKVLNCQGIFLAH